MVLDVRESCITSGNQHWELQRGGGGERTVTGSHQLGEVGNDSIMRE